MPSPYEFLCDEHINLVEVDDDLQPDKLHFWTRANFINSDGEPDFRCEHIDHDNAVRIVEAEGNDEHLPPPATWECWTYQQIDNNLGEAKTPDASVTPNDKLSEIIRMLQAQQRPPVLVSLKKSSSKDGNEGFDLDVVAGATVGDIEETITHALEGRKQILDTLYAPLSPDADA